MVKSLMLVLVGGLAGLAIAGCGSTDTAGTRTHSTSYSAARSTSTEAPAETLRSPKSPEEINAAKTRRYLDFGTIADEADAKAVAAITTRYYHAVAASDGAAACGLIHAGMAQAIPEDVGPLAGKRRTCAAVMSLLFRTRRGMPTADVDAIRVRQVRVKGNTAIALLRSPKMHSGELVLEREGSTWKVLDLLGSVLPVPTLVHLAH